MRGHFAATIALLLGGCVAVDEQPARYEELHREVQGVRNDVATASDAVAALSGLVRDRDASFSLRLEAIEHEMAKPIQVPTPICKAPEPVVLQAPQACEAPSATTVVESEEKITVGQ